MNDLENIESKMLEVEKTKLEVEMILANILLPMIITSKKDRVILYANHYAETQYEMPLDDIIGMDIDKLYSTEGQNTRLIHQMETQGFIDNVEEKFTTHNGNEFIALLSVTPIIYRGEEAYIGMVTDITKQKEREAKVKELLDNAGQGFLYFNSDMKIGSEYSKEVTRLLGDNLAQKNITTLLYPEDKEDRLNFTENLNYVLLEENEDIQNVLISLLPQEFMINNKSIKFQYKVLKKQTFMLILTDITREKELSLQVEYEQQVLKMVVETVSTMDQFLELKQDYEKFITRIDEFKDITKLSYLAREIHTFKGLFAQKEMLNIVKELHNFENYIVSSRKKNILDDVIKNISEETMSSWIRKDIEVLEKVLGDNIFNKSHNVSIDTIRIDELNKKVQHLYGHLKNNINSQDKKEFNEISKNIDAFNYNNINIYLTPYIKLVEQLATRLEKQINPLVIDSEDIFLDEEYKGFLNTLVHIFRNSVDHGIESVEDRYEQNKSDFGTIECVVKKDSEFLYIDIGDDGKGIDDIIIKKLAIDRGIYTEQEIEKLTEQEILKIIFLDSFSTNEVVTDISGRGVGLASILAELGIINGEMTIENKKGIGVKFKFKIPIK